MTATTAALCTAFERVTAAGRVSDDPADLRPFSILAPRLAVWPKDAAEVSAVLEAARDLRVRLTVIGAGTRRTQHIPPPQQSDCVALISTRMNAILELDIAAGRVHAQAGIRLADLEAALARQDLTLGPLPASVGHHTLGGVLADPPAEAHTPRDGYVASQCFALCAVTPAGATIQTRPVPRAAAGPHFGRLLLGSRGELGVITSATLGVRQLPDHEQVVAYGFATPLAAFAAARGLIRAGIRPTALRVCLGTATCRRFTAQPDLDATSTLVALLAGPRELVSAQQRYCDELAADNDGSAIPLAPSFRWRDRRDATAPAKQLHWRLHHSSTEKLLSAKNTDLTRTQSLLWIDEFDPDGANLWAGTDDAFEPPLADLIQADTPPFTRRKPGSTVEALRRALDPNGIMLATTRSNAPQEQSDD